MAILVLYMDKVLGWSDGRKGDTYGLFLALCYFVPLLGGWLGDRIIGQIRTVRAGAFLMALGYVGLAVSGPGRITTFYLGLLLIGLGTGIFKVNMAVLVGNLYAGKARAQGRRLQHLLHGREPRGHGRPARGHAQQRRLPQLHPLVLDRGGRHDLRPDHLPGGRAPPAAHGQRAGARRGRPGQNAAAAGPAAASPAAGPAPDKREERQRIATLVILFLIVIFFWVAFYQNSFGLTLFAERSTVVLKWLRPETYQFFEPFFILALTPLLLTLFGRLNRAGKEPSTPVKILLGMLIMSLAMAVMVFASLAGGNRDENIMSPSWLIGTYFIVTLAEILISPMGQSFVSKVAPPRIAGLMMGGWFAATAAGSYGSGLLGKSYSRLAHHEFFLLLAALMLAAAVLVAVFLRKLKRFAT
ncbi:MAG: hypothetical protein MZV64_11575 [Ignavibacteriales bacterium]|nr:hypothetical protein [Ignavibacteriales bacterium]